MTGPGGMDPRIRQALALLQSVAEERAAGPAPVHGPALDPATFLPPTLDPDLVSATDLLSMWLPEHLGGFGDRRERLLEDAHQALWPRRAPEPSFSAPALPPLPPQEPFPGASLEFLSRDDRLEDAHADAALDCLYAFLHALERRDIPAAMVCVAPSFHTVDATGEVDRRGLCLRLESLLDRLRGLTLEVSFQSLPEPIPHPVGILVPCTFQFDGRDAAGHPAPTLLLERVALLKQTAEGTWHLHALSQVEPL